MSNMEDKELYTMANKAIEILKKDGSNSYVSSIKKNKAVIKFADDFVELSTLNNVERFLSKNRMNGDIVIDIENGLLMLEIKEMNQVEEKS